MLIARLHLHLSHTPPVMWFQSFLFSYYLSSSSNTLTRRYLRIEMNWNQITIDSGQNSNRRNNNNEKRWPLNRGNGHNSNAVMRAHCLWPFFFLFSFCFCLLSVVFVFKLNCCQIQFRIYVFGHTPEYINSMSIDSTIQWRWRRRWSTSTLLLSMVCVCVCSFFFLRDCVVVVESWNSI